MNGLFFINSLLIYLESSLNIVIYISLFAVSIFGYCWRMGYVGVHSAYIYRSDGDIQATLGVRIGLRTVNLTLSGKHI